MKRQEAEINDTCTGGWLRNSIWLFYFWSVISATWQMEHQIASRVATSRPSWILRRDKGERRIFHDALPPASLLEKTASSSRRAHEELQLRFHERGQGGLDVKRRPRRCRERGRCSRLGHLVEGGETQEKKSYPEVSNRTCHEVRPRSAQNRRISCKRE